MRHLLFNRSVRFYLYARHDYLRSFILHAIIGVRMKTWVDSISDKAMNWGGGVGISERALSGLLGAASHAHFTLAL